jgi:hypothetical protein
MLGKNENQVIGVLRYPSIKVVYGTTLVEIQQPNGIHLVTTLIDDANDIPLIYGWGGTDKNKNGRVYDIVNGNFNDTVNVFKTEEGLTINGYFIPIIELLTLQQHLIQLDNIESALSNWEE